MIARLTIGTRDAFYRARTGGSRRRDGLISEGLTELTRQTVQAPGGPTTVKVIYKHCYRHCYLLGISESDPELSPACIEDKNGHILPYVRFRGGWLRMTEEALSLLARLAE